MNPVVRSRRDRKRKPRNTSYRRTEGPSGGSTPRIAMILSSPFSRLHQRNPGAISARRINHWK